jgi:hypothetical protein
MIPQSEKNTISMIGTEKRSPVAPFEQAANNDETWFGLSFTPGSGRLQCPHQEIPGPLPPSAGTISIFG